MRIVFATHNKNKLKEVKALLPSDIELLSLTDIGCLEEIPETSETIEGNAVLKADYIFENYGYDCFADDTGLEVQILNNAPGVYSARYGGPEKNSDLNKAKLLKELINKNNRTARFKTAIALHLQKDSKLFLGICEGKITSNPRGEKGFGYDSIFQPNGFDKTFAEMDLDQKSKIGHRGKAVRQLIEYFLDS